MAKASDTIISEKNDSVKDKVQSGRLLVGTTTYHINVRFGKISLEEILKNRILNGVKRA